VTETRLIRGVGLGSAVALNMTDMIGVGPFITMPLIVAAMGGPQAMLGWAAGALLAICDGLVWAELGAAMPRAGGSYGFLEEIYGRRKLGRLLAFLFVWQLSFSAPLSIASGAVGLSRYASYLWPSLDRPLTTPLHSSLLGLQFTVTLGTFVAIGIVLLAVVLLYRRINVVGKLAGLLWVGVMATIGWVIVAGVTHFNSGLAFDFPAGAFTLSRPFFLGLGSALLVASYDYWGYYNICFLGEEVKDPGRTIPRAMIWSILAVCAIYLVMNVSILGVVPWRELKSAADSDTRFYVVSTMMQRVYGNWAGGLAAVLIMWTAFASVFSLLLGYSRIPFAAARDGNYFPAFARLHARGQFPHVSLLALGVVAAAACFLALSDLIKLLVIVRVVTLFLPQTIGVIVLRLRRPEMPRPFRMWLYPLPALLATAGFVYIVVKRPNAIRELRVAAILIAAGLIIYLVRSALRHQWPFARTAIEAGASGHE
jgi:APA family basic amino acid/polyamine antiporter